LYNVKIKADSFKQWSGVSSVYITVATAVLQRY